MKEIVILLLLSGLVFVIFLICFIFGVYKKNNSLKMIALFALFLFVGVGAWTAYRLMSKTYHHVADTFSMRTGEEIYVALFGESTTDCVKVKNYQDQIIPKIDYAIWLHVETCPEELERILAKHDFNAEQLSTKNWSGKIPYGETLEWLNPKQLGDTIWVYEYSTNNSKTIQTIWSNLDRTEVMVRAIFD